MSYSPYLLKDQKALVTGSSSGISEAAARNLAKAGALVTLDVSSCKLTSITKKAGAFHV